MWQRRLARMPMLGWLLFLLFIVLPIVEVYLLVQIGQAIGLRYTVAIIIGTGILGAFLAKTQGFRAWRDVQRATAQGRMPGVELGAGALFLVGAAFLLTPGVITDGVGFLLMVPTVRRWSARRLARMLRGRVVVHTFGGRGATAQRPDDQRSRDDVIDVEAEEHGER